MIPFRFPMAALAAEDDGPGGSPGFSPDEVRTLRLRAAELEAEAAKAREALAAEREAAALRIVRAEVAARAARAGMVDPDGVKLMDLSGVRLSGAGEVEGAEAAIEAARRARPWLFSDARTGNPEPPPRPRDAREGGDARRMTAKEYEAARKARAWRR